MNSNDPGDALANADVISVTLGWAPSQIFEPRTIMGYSDT